MALENMPTLELQDWSASDSLPGYRLKLDNDSLILVRQLDNGISLSWDSEASAREVIEASLPDEGKDDLEAIARDVQNTSNNRPSIHLVGAEDILEAVGDPSIWWVKWLSPGHQDYGVFIGPKEDILANVTILSPTLNPNVERLFLDPEALMRKTGTPEVQLMASYIMQRLVPDIDPKAQTKLTVIAS